MAFADLTMNSKKKLMLHSALPEICMHSIGQLCLTVGNREKFLLQCTISTSLHGCYIFVSGGVSGVNGINDSLYPRVQDSDCGHLSSCIF